VTSAPTPSKHGRRVEALAIVLRMLWPLQRLRTSTPGGVALVRRHWLLAVVLGAYAAVLPFVPVMVPAAVNDDWIWTRSLEILLDEGRLVIFEISAPSAVFQVLWAAPFAAMTDNVFGAARLATVTFVGLTAAGLYGLCRALEVGRERSALGTAAFLFSPLVFALSYTFMTDLYSAGFVVVAVACYARGLRGDARADRFLWWGSVAAALAYLQRATGVLVPVGVVAFLLVTGRVRPDRSGAATLARVAVVPALTALAFTLFGSAVVGESATQELFREAIRDAGWDDLLLHVGRMAYIHVMYTGLFVVPLVVGALGAVALLARRASGRGWLLVAACAAIVGGGLAGFSRWAMPSVPQFLGPWGLGPSDIIGGRPTVLGAGGEIALTAACAASALVLAVALGARTARGDEAAWRGPAGLVAVMITVQAVATAVPSLLFADSYLSFDRYLVPIAPLAIALTLWALRDVRMLVPVAWAAVVLGAVLSVQGTRDHLRFQHAVWDLARNAHASGVALTELDAGYSWDAYHLYELSRDLGITQRTPQGPWWVGDLFAPATDSRFVVAGHPLHGYTIVDVRGYPQWGQDASLYLLERDEGAEATAPRLISVPRRPPG
jgi:4-amino-4-deoxy-L-arabinose transferase-like glycosyltransferase